MILFSYQSETYVDDFLLIPFSYPTKINDFESIKTSITTVLYYTILWTTILYYTILYYTILFYTILYYTIL